MKKALFILPIIATLVFTGCKKTNKNKKGDVVNDLVLKANVPALRKFIYSDFNMTNKSINVENISKVSYNKGFIRVTDTSGKYHFYSIIKNSVLVSNVNPTATVALYASSNAGGYLRVTENGSTYVYDGLGNVLLDDYKVEFTSIEVNDVKNPKKPEVCYTEISIVKTDSTVVKKYYVYSSNGQATSVATIDSDVNDDYGQGSTIQGLSPTTLDDYGHPGYKRFKNSSRYIIFDNNNPANEIASFTDPVAQAEFFVGDYFIYQNSVKLDDNNNNYDYIDAAGQRYSLETYRINYLTAKSEAINVKYVISSSSDKIKPLFDEKSVYNYVYADVRTISDKKILSNTIETNIIDSSGALHDNITGIDLGEFERIGNNYFNKKSLTIYDGNLNEISILSNMNPQLIPNANLIICQVEGNYGAVNSEGKVVIPFKYDYISPDYISDNRLLAIDSGKVSILNFNATTCTYSLNKSFDDFNEVSYVKDDKAELGAGVFMINGPTTDPRYISVFSSTPVDFRTSPTSVMEVKINTANAIDKSVVFSLETLADALVNYQSSDITITH